MFREWGKNVKERPVVFGQQVSNVGIVTESPGDGGASTRPACLLLNAGLVHRVGPNRLHVRIARSIAAAGYPVLRFDLSGRGDSDVRRDGMSFLESSVAETRGAMDFLQSTRGCDQFVLIGICSGAVNALQVASCDPRVVGGVMIDGPAYPTGGYYLRYYVKRLSSLESWWNTVTARNELGRRLWGNLAPSRVPEDELGNPFGDVAMPSRAKAGEFFEGIVSRGTRLLFIYTGSWGMYNYRAQFRDAFPALMRQGAVRVDYFPNADHTFTRLYNQERLLWTIGRWVESNWSSHPTTLQPPTVAGHVRQPVAVSPGSEEVVRSNGFAYDIRHCDVKEAESYVIRLSNANLPSETDRYHRYQWYYVANPEGRGNVFLLWGRDKDGISHVIGCTGIGLRLFKRNGHVLRAALSADFAVDHAHRTVLPALKLQRAAHEYAGSRCDLSYGFPNSSAIGVFMRLGYKQLGKMSRYVKVLQHEPYLRRIGPMAELAPAAAGLLDSIEYVRECYRAAWVPSHLRFHWASDFDSRFDVLGERMAQHAAVVGQRTAEWLRWRFSPLSGSPCLIATLVDQSSRELRAYAVIAQKEAGVARIGDFGAITQSDLSSLLARLVPELRSKGYMSASVHFLGPQWVSNLLRRHRFNFREADRPMVIDPRAGTNDDLLLNPTNWYLTAADTDT